MYRRLFPALLGALFVAMLAVVPAHIGPVSADVAVTSPDAETDSVKPVVPNQSRRESPCGGEIEASVATDTVPACNETEIQVDLSPECPVCPGGINVIFVQLAQARQSGWQNQEAVRILDEVERYALDFEPENVQIGVIQYDQSGSRVVQRLTDDFNRARGQLNDPGNGYIAQGDAEAGANEAVRMLREARRKSQESTADPCEIVVMFAHVKSHDSHADNLRRAGQTIKRETRNFLVGCPIDPGSWYCVGPEPEMPPSQRNFAKYNEAGKLLGVARNMIREWEQGEVSVRELELVQVLPTGVDFVEGSASVEPADVITDYEGTTVTWRWDSRDVEDSHEVAYRVRPAVTGHYTITGEMRVIDTARLLKVVEVPDAPVLHVEVDDCPLGTPEPTLTPEPDIPTATPTHTPTEPPPTVTPTATVGHHVIYLPILLGEKCEARKRHADVVLVMDISTSMARHTEAGRPKIEAMAEAATAFVNSMNLEPDAHGNYDQVAVVGFNRDAWIEQAMTSDPEVLETAIGRLPAKMQEYTRLDLALLTGAEALDTEARNPDNLGVIVLLTDGLPNQVPLAEDGAMETTVLRAADEVKAAGATIYTVGVGNPNSPDLIERINPELLTEIASTPSMYYETLDAEALSEIYSHIAISIGCPGGRHDWSQPWP